MNPTAREEYLRRAAQLAVDNVGNGGGPFGAVLITAAGEVFDGVNRVTASNDPTAHAEVVAIRDACAQTGTFDLTGAELYASCEPCPMCLASALWARVDRVFFLADRHDAAAAGFDDARFYEYFDTPPDERDMAVTQVHLGEDDRLAPFTRWRDLADRVEY